MPSFAAAFTHLGAALRAMDRPDEGAQAFEQALLYDDANDAAWINVGVCRREMGQLAESEAAFRKAIELSPDFAVGFYDLGHTLFLSQRFDEALEAYVEGQRLDVERDPAQAARAALARLGCGDADGARWDLDECLARAAPADRAEILAAADEVARALQALSPGLGTVDRMLEAIGTARAAYPTNL